MVNILENIPRGLSKINSHKQIPVHVYGIITSLFKLSQTESNQIITEINVNYILLQLLYVLYVSTVQFNFVSMLAVINTVLMMSETSSTLSKENDSKKKLHITQQQEKQLYQHLTYLL